MESMLSPENSNISLPSEITFENAEAVYQAGQKTLSGKDCPNEMAVDAGAVCFIDSAGAAVLHRLIEQARLRGCELTLINTTVDINKTLQLFRPSPGETDAGPKRGGFFERSGQSFFNLYLTIGEVLALMANIFYWTLLSFFKRKLRRRSEVINQSLLIGVNALPIIGLIAFLIGFILALQSAAQLRQFGANIYVAHLLTIAMVSEMGPLITAIMVAGRSGSAIAAEIATMVVTEEIDALRVMGIDPLPYLVSPKLLAICVMLPLLTVFANVIGVLGGMIIGVTYLDLDVIPFLSAALSVLRYKEIIISIIKSLTFAVIIVITGAHFGLRVSGGAEGVGKATTASVVFSIFWVILADSLIGLLFYFGGAGF
jgi:phospholipid/cholesterol/gamma-HCH transport system permease protein